MTKPLQFSYSRSADQNQSQPVHHKVIVVGAGPVGLVLALDLARRGVRVLLLDDATRIGEGSRAICFAKRTLEVLDSLSHPSGTSVAEAMVARGVTWSRGKVFLKDAPLYEFDLLPEGGHKMPAFINIPQYEVEQLLVEAVMAQPLIDLRWGNKVSALELFSSRAKLTIDTPEGAYKASSDYVVACDGSRSPTRTLLGLDFRGEMFEDQFLIADVKMAADFPTERWFWFDPPFHDGQSALLHRQPDDVWRIDLQLGREADAAHERKPEVVRPRIAAMLGHEDFTLEWVSVYRFQCRRMEHFLHGRVIFAGDSAHQVSPFGARGANSGIQDADNIGWKLARVVQGLSPDTLLETYDSERVEAADENILNSTRATDFIAPRSPGERVLRDAALALAGQVGFAKRFVNSGRLSLPTAYDASRLSSDDDGPWIGGVPPGAPLLDVPLVQNGTPVWLSGLVHGLKPALVHYAPSGPISAVAGLEQISIMPASTPAGEGGDIVDAEALFAQRYGMQPGDAVLLRPDGHMAARFRAARSDGSMSKIVAAFRLVNFTQGDENRQEA